MVSKLTGSKSSRFSFLLMVTSCLIFLICNLFTEYKLASIVSLLAFFAYLVLIIFLRPTFLFKYLAFLFACVANIFGVASIEFSTPFYLNELRCFSHFTGSLPLCVLGWWAFISSLYCIDGRGLKQKDESEISTKADTFQKALSPLTFVVFCLASLLYIKVLPSPSFLLGLDRFSYQTQFIQGIWGNIAIYLPFLMVIPMFAIKERGSKLGYAAVIIYCLYLFWTGSKFGEFFTILCLFFLVYFDKFKSFSKHALRKITLVALSVCVGIVAFSGFAFSFTSDTPVDEFYSSRISQQGQLFWSISANNDGENHVDDFFDNEIPSLFNNESISESVGAHHGIYLAMYESAPSDVVNSKLSTGSRYTEAGFACAFYYFGLVGVVAFGVLMALFVSLIVNSVLKAISEKKIIKSIICIRFYSLVRTALSMFLFAQFFTPLSIGCFIYIVFSSLVNVRYQRNGKRRT